MKKEEFTTELHGVNTEFHGEELGNGELGMSNEECTMREQALLRLSIF